VEKSTVAKVDINGISLEAQPNELLSVESFVNRLTSSHTDPVTNTPAYKKSSVHMKVLAKVGESPLPRINPRFGHPTPPNGGGSRTQVEATGLCAAGKWQWAVTNEKVK
jgi:predicted molibdopterin-dependent oxidoreductase YjgC